MRSKFGLRLLAPWGCNLLRFRKIQTPKSKRLRGIFFGMNETELKLRSNGREIIDWGERFVGALSNPTDIVSLMVQKGIDAGLDEDTSLGRKKIARDLGKIYNFVFIEETGGERFAEDLDVLVIEENTGIAADRQQKLIELMVKSYWIKSKTEAEKRKRGNGNRF